METEGLFETDEVDVEECVQRDKRCPTPAATVGTPSGHQPGAALQWTEVDIEQQRLKKFVKKSDKPLSLPLNDTAFQIIAAR